MLQERLFVAPPREVLSGQPGHYREGFHTYSEYNYFRGGLISRLKRYRFEVALRLAEPLFHEGAALDFGCADGVLLPSLSPRFAHVVGVDRSAEDIRTAHSLAAALELSNVTVLCNEGMSMRELAGALPDLPYRVLFLLETLEHVGDASALYESKVAFVDQLFALLQPEAHMVISVPRMVGAPLLAKHAVQTVLRLPRERYGWRELLRAGVLRRTDDLESQWDGTHFGFNEEKLARYLGRAFRVVRRFDLPFASFFLLRAPKRAASAA